MLLFAFWACARPPPEIATLDPVVASTPEAAPDCGRWAGIGRIGTQWEAKSTLGYQQRHGFAGTGVTVVQAVRGATIDLAHTGAYQGATGRVAVERHETWRCDAAGAWWTASTATSTATWDGGGTTVSVTREFDPGILVRPAELVAGATWTTPVTVTIRAAGREPTVKATSCHHEVGPAMERVVPAGRFPAHELRVDCDGTSVPPVWLTEGTGWLADPDLELVAYRP